MASTIKNVGGQPTKLTRGKPVNLGTIVSANDVVAFTVPEPSRDHHGKIAVQAVGGTTPTLKLEVSLDGGTTFWDISPTFVTTADFGDTASTGAAQVDVSGLGSGAQFRLGRTDANGGNCAVWALCG